MKLIPFNYYSILASLKSGWATFTKGQVNEGLRMVSNIVTLDFKEDLKGDVVKLNPPTKLGSVRKEGIPIYRGYLMEKVDDRKSFMSAVKKWGALDPENLKQLVSLTYPDELLNKKIEIIFITGSSDPLSENIAKAIKELYYPDCKIIDITKKYYGNDVSSIIDWERYDKADARTKEMIDTFISRYKYGKDLSQLPRERFEGYIKKSSGLQSGARRLLKPGHEIDDFVLSNIIAAEEDWRSEYLNNPAVNPNAKLKNRPNYLLVDDTIIEGSTVKGIFNTLLDILNLPQVKFRIGESAQYSIYGYCLFSYKK